MTKKSLKHRFQNLAGIPLREQTPDDICGCMDPNATNYNPQATFPGAGPMEGYENCETYTVQNADEQDGDMVDYTGVQFGAFVCNYHFTCQNWDDGLWPETLYMLSLQNQQYNPWFEFPDIDQSINPNMDPELAVEDMASYVCNMVCATPGGGGIDLNPGQYCPACNQFFDFEVSLPQGASGDSVCDCCPDPVLPGCTDENALNTNDWATEPCVGDPGFNGGPECVSPYEGAPVATGENCCCLYSMPGCTDPEAENYNEDAAYDDGSCEYSGCTDNEALNYDPDVNVDDGSCIYAGGTDEEASNYDPDADEDDGSCWYGGCTDEAASNYDETATVDDGSCLYPGCTDEDASNFDEDANTDDGSCLYPGCMDDTALNYDETANIEDGSCLYGGCLDPTANNYDETADENDGSCLYNGWICDAAETEDGTPPESWDKECQEFTDLTLPLDDAYWPAVVNAGVVPDIPYATYEECEEAGCGEKPRDELGGCMDPNANNYNDSPNLDYDDGSCEYTVWNCENVPNADGALTGVVGCVESITSESPDYVVISEPYATLLACEMNCISTHTPSDIEGCTDPNADNYSPSANIDDDSCEYCMEYDSWDEATQENTCCFYYQNPDNIGDDGYALIDDQEVWENLLDWLNAGAGYAQCCPPPVQGCTDEAATNYDPEACLDDNSCTYPEPCEEFDALEELQQTNMCNWWQGGGSTMMMVPSYDWIEELLDGGECCPQPTKYSCVAGWGAAEGEASCSEDPEGDFDTIEDCQASGCGFDCNNNSAQQFFEAYGGQDSFCAGEWCTNPENLMNVNLAMYCQCCECTEDDILIHINNLESGEFGFGSNTVYAFCSKCDTSIAASGVTPDPMCECCPEIRYSCVPNVQPDGSVNGSACVEDPEGPYYSASECQAALGTNECPEDDGCPSGGEYTFENLTELMQDQCCHMSYFGYFYPMDPEFIQANYPDDWTMVGNPCQQITPACCTEFGWGDDDDDDPGGTGGPGISIDPGTIDALEPNKKLQVPQTDKQTPKK